MPSGSGGTAKEGDSTRARERAAGMGLDVLLERIQAGCRRLEFEGGGGGERRSCVIGTGKSNSKGTTDGFVVTNTTLGKQHNAPLEYAPVLEINHPIMSKLGNPGGRLEIEREIKPHPR